MGENRKFWPGKSISLRIFTLMVSLQDFLPILGGPRPKITNRSSWCHATKWWFWPACDQNLDSVLLKCDHGSNSQYFDMERLRTFTPMVPKVSLHDSLPILDAPWPKIWIWSFSPRCNQIGQISKVFYWREYFSPKLTPMVPKVSLHDFLLILAAYCQTFRFGLVRAMAKTVYWERFTTLTEELYFFTNDDIDGTVNTAV